MDLPPGYPGFHETTREISVTSPISAAIDHTKRILFPFKLGRWLSLGFVAWLAHLGEGGGSSLNIPDTSSGRSGGPSLKPAVDWVIDNLGLVIAGSVVLLLVGVGISALLLWLSSRGRFMFIDDLVKNEDKVEEPWREFADRAWRLFKFRFGLSLLGGLVGLLGIAVFLWIAWPELQTGVFETQGLIGALVAVALVAVFGIPLGIIGALVDDFVVPAMYLHDESVGEAWRRVRSEIIQGRVGTIVLFYLVQFGLGMVVGLIAVVVTCITLCIAALPYIGTVILLPLIVFNRAYVLAFIEQFGPNWQLFRRENTEPAW